MPPVKPRDMEDTWNPAELGRSLKESKEKKRRPRDGDRDEDRRRKERPKDDDDKKHRRRKEEDGEKPRERKDRERDKDRDREKDRDRHKDRERRHRDKENGEGESKRRSKNEDEVDGGRRRRRHEDESKEDDKERRRRRAPDDDDNDEERRKRREERRKKKDEEGSQEKEKRRHRDGEEKERRTKDGGDREKRHRDREDREKRHKDGEDRERKHRDRDGEREHRKRRDQDGEDRRKRDENGERHRDRRDKDRDRDREHRDRDRDRDRRRDKEALEDEGNHRRHRDKDKDKEKVEKKEVEETKTSSKKDDDDEYDYDDDFEDYEEDFEDDDDENEEDEMDEKDRVTKQKGKDMPPITTPRSGRDITSGYIRSKNWGADDKSRDEMDDILKAMDAENDRLLTESKRDKYEDRHGEEDDRRGSKRPTTGKPRSFINFVSAKQRVITNKASMKAKTRGRELLQLIELDKAAYDLFDMPPVSEYELYIRTYGRSDTKQKYVQTNEDNVDKDIQTEDIETREMWCQCPPEDTKGCGGDKESAEDLETKPIDTVGLTKFVQNAGQVILILLEEDRVEAAQSDTTKKRSNICLSEAFLELEPPPFLRGRCVSFTHFSDAQTHLLLSVYDRPTKPKSKDSLSTKGAICVWNVNETSQPQKILVCEGQPKCCCFSPEKPTLVFAGMSDGSLALWDLREDNSIHKSLVIDDQTWYIRSPTYNTAGVLHYENHQSGVTSLVPIYVLNSANNMDDSEIEGSTSFQLASVEENAVVNLWVVAEISSPEPGGSESDLGLAPHGRVKLIKSSAITLENPLREARLRTTMKAFEMQLLPTDPSHFYVGTDTGHIIHGVRFGGKAPPKAYKPDIDAPVEVTSLDFSPFTEPVFLAGCADGSLRLYHIGNPSPLLVWESTTDHAPILTVRWCQSRPSVFFVVDVTSRLYIWDLLMSDAVPMKEEKISQDRLTSFCISRDYAATGLGVAGRKPAMAVSFDDGRIEVHTVSQQFSALMPEEVDQFAQFLGNAL